MATLYYESSFAHHGTIGQKWGIRRYQNKDGSLTDLGRARAKEFAIETAFNDPYIKNSQAMKRLEKYRDDYERLLRPAAKLHQNEKLNDSYLRKAAYNSANELGFDTNDKVLMDELFRGYKYDDLNQGSGTAYELYMKDRGKDYDKHIKEVTDLFCKITKDGELIGNAVLTRFGNRELKKMTKYGSRDAVNTMEVAISDHLLNELYKKGYYTDE